MVVKVQKTLVSKYYKFLWFINNISVVSYLFLLKAKEKKAKRTERRLFLCIKK